MLNSKVQGIKIKVEDFRQAALNKTKYQEQWREEVILKNIKEMKKPSIWNLWNIFGVISDENARIEYLAAEKGSPFRSELSWAKPDYEEEQKMLSVADLVCDEHMWVDMKTARFVSKYSKMVI
jgi:hypothetical protein